MDYRLDDPCSIPRSVSPPIQWVLGDLNPVIIEWLGNEDDLHRVPSSRMLELYLHSGWAMKMISI
jgi:hypothetical protein